MGFGENFHHQGDSTTFPRIWKKATGQPKRNSLINVTRIAKHRQFCWRTLGSRRFLAPRRAEAGRLVPLRATRSESVSASRTVCALQSPQPSTEFRPLSRSHLTQKGRAESSALPDKLPFEIHMQNRLFHFADLEYTINSLELLDHLIRQRRIHIDKGICVIPFGFICHSGDI